MPSADMTPELREIARRLCGHSSGQGDVAVLAKQRASRQIMSYLQVLLLRLRKDHYSAQAQLGERDSMLFMQHLRRFE